ncbi:MAG: helix-turn-helix domain-containing protein [Candidatus Curtissbacteria bacterium]
MTRFHDRETVLDLRAQGKSYSQIKEILHISKSTLSVWLKDYPLSKDQIDALRGKSPIRIEKYRNTMRLKREERLRIVYENQNSDLLPLTKKELLIAGLFLYWGEGSKTTGAVSLNNTDSSVLRFTLYWLVNICNVPRNKIRVNLHLYRDMNINHEMLFWSKNLKIPLSQFAKPYIKNSNREHLTQKGYGHGTCGLVVNDIRLKEKIMMGIKAISDYYSLRI